MLKLPKILWHSSVSRLLWLKLLVWHLLCVHSWKAAIPPHSNVKWAFFWTVRFAHIRTLLKSLPLSRWLSLPSTQRGDTTRSDLTIVWSTGIFTRSVQWCTCTKSPDQCVQLLLHAKLFPATFKNPKTVFTFEVLDHFWIDALECKTAAMNFMSKLGRITNEAFPSQVPVSGPMVGWCSHTYDMVQDHYRELLSVSRQWWDLHNRIRARVVHDQTDHPVEGGLALFTMFTIWYPPSSLKDLGQCLWHASMDQKYHYHRGTLAGLALHSLKTGPLVVW